MPLSEGQWKALAIIPHFSAGLSLLGSLVIINDIRGNKQKLRKVYHRLILGLSIFDSFSSCAYFFSTWPIPADSSGPVQFARGTTETCVAQGFFIQLGIGGPLYNLCLGIYYLLVLKYRWTESQVAKIEKYFHVISWTMGIILATIPIPLKLYNNSNLWCWISSLPGSCSNSPNGTGDCIRGENAWIFRWALYYAPLWFLIVAVTIIMIIIIHTINAQEKKSRRWRLHAGSSAEVDSTRRMSKRAFGQSIHYLLSFYITFISPTILRGLQTAGESVPYAIFVSMTLLMPMQGFFNATVYFSARIQRAVRGRVTAMSSVSGVQLKSNAPVVDEIEENDFKDKTSDQNEEGSIIKKDDSPAEDIEENDIAGNTSHKKVEGSIERDNDEPSSYAKRVDHTGKVTAFLIEAKIP